MGFMLDIQEQQVTTNMTGPPHEISEPFAWQ